MTAQPDPDPDGYVSGLDVAIKAAERFRDAVLEDVAAMERLDAALDREEQVTVTLDGDDSIWRAVQRIALDYNTRKLALGAVRKSLHAGDTHLLAVVLREHLTKKQRKLLAKLLRD